MQQIFTARIDEKKRLKPNTANSEYTVEGKYHFA
jgi:hypothetical protein